MAFLDRIGSNSESEPTHREKEKVNQSQQKATIEVHRESEEEEEEEEERCIILPEVAFAVVEIVSSLSLSIRVLVSSLNPLICNLISWNSFFP